MRAYLIGFYFLSFLFVLSTYYLKAQEYEVDGSIHFSAFRRSKLEYEEYRDFSLAFNGTNWIIRTAKKDTLDRSEKAYIGNLLFTLHSGYAESYSIPIVGNAGKIEEFMVPDPDGSRINVIWLAYCSGPYFKLLNNSKLHPIWLLDDPDLRLTFMMDANWQLQNDLLGLPLSVEYINDGFFHGINSKGVKVSFKEKSPFSFGYTQAVFKVESSTNLSSYSLPLSCNFLRYSVANGDYELLTKETIHTINIKTNTILRDFHPQYSGRIDIADGRFKIQILGKTGSYSYFRYSAFNNIWPSVDEIARKHSIASSFIDKHNENNTKSAYNVKRIMIIIVLILSPFLSVVVYKTLKTRN